MKSAEQETLHEDDLDPQDIPPFSRLWLVVTLIVLLAAGGVLGLVVYSGIASRVRANTALKQRTTDMAVPAVEVVHPKLVALSRQEAVFPGNIQAFVATPIYARTNGYLKAWYADIGTHVKSGQLLAEIEAPEIDRQLDQARADLATAEANYALSKTTAERYQTLIKTDSVSKQDLDDRVGDMHAKKAMLDSAGFNVRRLEETQRFQKIYAPFDGVITARNVDRGALIDAGANAPGKQLFDLAAINRLRVYVNVSQADSRAAKPGTPADLTLTEFPGRHFPGKIVRTSEAIDPASRTMLTEVDVDNPTGELLPGAFVSVHLNLASKGTGVLLPVNSLMFRSEGLRVGVVRDGKAILAPVVMGRDFGTEVEIVSGLGADEAVIANPSDSLTSGAAVRAVESKDLPAN